MTILDEVILPMPPESTLHHQVVRPFHKAYSIVYGGVDVHAYAIVVAENEEDAHHRLLDYLAEHEGWRKWTEGDIYEVREADLNHPSVKILYDGSYP